MKYQTIRERICYLSRKTVLIPIFSSMFVFCTLCAAEDAGTITVTNLNDSGPGSLRQAIADAAPGDTIDFDANVFATPQTITLTSGQLVIDKNLAIQGPGASLLSVSGNNATRVFTIIGGVMVRFEGITITDGHADGFVAYGGGIFNNATLTVSNSRISGNAASPSGFGNGQGGGIFNNGTLTVSNSSIYYNYADSLQPDYTESIAEGGGIFSPGTLTISNSTISLNYVGAFTESEAGTGSASGGGIFNSGVLRLSNTTIYGNEGYGGGDRGGTSGVGIYTPSYSVLTNTIVAGNSASCVNGCENDIVGIVNNASHNLIGDANSSGGIQNGVNGNIVGVNPLLGPLRHNGGPTLTHALVPESPAINAGDNCVLVANGCGFSHPALPTDQRGFSRVETVDIGAFERQTNEASYAAFDFDGDGRSDVSVFRPSDRVWYLDRSTQGFTARQFGLSTDKITPADFDGDGRTDVAVYRPSTGIWYWLNSSNGVLHAVQFGSSEDLPTPADYDGDGHADVSVFRPSNGTWYRLNSHDGSFHSALFGLSGDRPTAGDYNGDGRADLAVFRPSNGTWYWSSDLVDPSHNVTAVPFGLSTDLVTPADFDGDGKTDIAVCRPSTGTWYSLDSSTGAVVATQFGLAEDIPTAADFDGDGRADISVFRPSSGVWYRLNSSNGSFFAAQFGLNGDRPTPAAFRY